MWGKRGCHPAYDTQQESRKRLSSKQTVFLGILSSGRFVTVEHLELKAF